jgi:hypothetical protein
MSEVAIVVDPPLRSARFDSVYGLVFLVVSPRFCPRDLKRELSREEVL